MASFNRRWSLVWLLPMMLAVTASADVVTLEPIKDNTLYEDANGSLSNGAGVHFFVGRTGIGRLRRGLIAFDVAGNIDAGATINSATLSLDLSRTIAGAQTVQLRRATADWGEGSSNSNVRGGGMGAAATANDATWIHRFFDHELWGTPGGDFSATVTASASIDAIGAYAFPSNAQMVTDVQDWLDDAAGNFGWILIGNETAPRTAKRFDSRENTNPANRPVLTIDFTPPPVITDCNGNGIDDALDIANGTSLDCDGNGVPDECQDDSDGDGTIDPCDGCPNDANKTAPGDCGCGAPDTDSDGDGVADCDDACPNDPNKVTPGDCGCGQPDVDSDGDGVPDCVDACPNDPRKTAPGDCGCGQPDVDSDGDGVPDCVDGCPDDPNKIVPGVLGCGVEESDRDGDGVPDSVDLCPDDPNKADPGDCGCGTPDEDSDGDGVPDCVDLCPNDPNKAAPGDCGCGVADVDSDSDGIPDCDDLCPNDPNKSEPGDCGCGVPDTDSDGDGVADCNDRCPDDPDKVLPGECGCGAPDLDSDGDGVLDCDDLCPGADDTLDTDGDRVVDCLDNCPETPNPDQADADGDGVGDACQPGIAPTLPECGPCGMGSMPGMALLLAGLFLAKVGRGRDRRFLGKAPHVQKEPPR